MGSLCNGRFNGWTNIFSARMKFSIKIHVKPEQIQKFGAVRAPTSPHDR
jgi:putative heme degradation protein